MTILILAAGQQQRWGDKPIKQLLPINDTTIIERIIKQCTDRKHNPIIITHRPELSGLNVRVFEPLKHRYTVESLYYSASLWYEQTVILLGDVIYSHNALDMIFDCNQKIRVFGNQWEIFALSFSNCQIDCLLRTIQLAEQGKRKGTLRDFFRVLTNTDKNDINHKWFQRVCFINDYTNDIDTPEEYQAFLDQHLVTMIHDDNRK